MNVQSEVMFRDLLRAAMKPKMLSQHDLAFHVNASQTIISLVGSHKRELSDKLAIGFAKVLGGTRGFWLATYHEFYDGRAKPINFYLDEIDGGFSKGQLLGTGVRRLLNDEMIKLFWATESRSDCLIQGFDPRRVRPSSYYTRLGYVVNDESGPKTPLREHLTIKPNQSLKVGTLETFHLPYWLEAQFHPASAMANHGLTVEHGPSIDPGFDKGSLRVTVRNVLDREITWDTELPFLKLHFLIFDRAAKTEAELRREYDFSDLTDNEIYRSATAEVI